MMIKKLDKLLLDKLKVLMIILILFLIFIKIGKSKHKIYKKLNLFIKKQNKNGKIENIIFKLKIYLCLMFIFLYYKFRVVLHLIQPNTCK